MMKNSTLDLVLTATNRKTVMMLEAEGKVVNVNNIMMVLMM